nr:hypothetical protein [Tanacetum cinerariifolium]GFA04446.1 hypothetical protein [Tanacetum cinerariifolium]
MDEALVPHAKRLRIGRSNFRLLSNISSKESTLQLVYDVLRLTSFFKAFLVTADVSEIYMQEFLPTATVHHHSIRFNMDNKKHIVNLESFREILHICPRLSTSAKGKKLATTSKAKSLSALSEVAMTEVQQLKLATKKSLQQTHISQASGSGADERTGTLPGVPDVPTNESKEEISWNSTDEEGDDDEGKDGDGDDEGNDDDDDEQDDSEAQDDVDQEDKGNDEVDEEEGSDDEQAFDEEEFIHPSLSTHAKEETKDEESFDPISKTPKNTDDEGNGEKNVGIYKRLKNLTNVGREEGHDDGQQQSSSVSSQFVTKANFFEFMQTNQFAGAVSSIPRIVHRYMDQQMNEAVKVKEQIKVQVSKILPKIEQTVNEQLEAEVLTQSSNSLKTSYDVAADLSEMELKKILIEKMEGN